LSTFLILKKMQIKTTLRFYHIEAGVVAQVVECKCEVLSSSTGKKKDFTSFLLECLSSRTQTTNVGKDFGGKEPLLNVGGSVN
jgi:hypothetical protein